MSVDSEAVSSVEVEEYLNVVPGVDQQWWSRGDQLERELSEMILNFSSLHIVLNLSWIENCELMFSFWTMDLGCLKIKDDKFVSGVRMGGGGEGLQGLDPPLFQVEPPLFLAPNFFYQEVHSMFCARN